MVKTVHETKHSNPSQCTGVIPMDPLLLPCHMPLSTATYFGSIPPCLPFWKLHVDLWPLPVLRFSSKFHKSCSSQFHTWCPQSYNEGCTVPGTAQLSDLPHTSLGCSTVGNFNKHFYLIPLCMV